MEELLYSVEIYKNDTDYSGKIFSNNNEIKDFHSKNIDDVLRDVEIKEVEKMLKCDTLGFRLFSCPNCGEFELVHFGCNSRLCTFLGETSLY